MKPTPREAKRIHEDYQKVVAHLVSEGYAENAESADDIIRGMSESWFNLIISE